MPDRTPGPRPSPEMVAEWKRLAEGDRHDPDTNYGLYALVRNGIPLLPTEGTHRKEPHDRD